jgi:hypothetical protein
MFRLDPTHGRVCLPDPTQAREVVLVLKHMKRCQELSEHYRILKPLNLGKTVDVQNQHGNSPKKWELTDIVVEKNYFEMYTVKLDESGQLTVRNRRFLKPFQSYKDAISKPLPVGKEIKIEQSLGSESPPTELRRSSRVSGKTRDVVQPPAVSAAPRRSISAGPSRTCRSSHQ